MLLLKHVFLEVQRVGEDGEREVDGGRDRALDNFVWFPYVY
jgi:hypothetical protein